MTKINVAIVNDCFGVGRMFARHGSYHVSNWSPGAKGFDLLVLTGGSDINPELYKEKPKYCSWFDNKRDDFEVRSIKENFTDVMKVGICRGAQLLNVLNGGTLWQDVNNHSGQHMSVDLRTGRNLILSSAHHQMMRPVGDFELIATARRATQYRAEKEEINKPMDDPEVIWFPKTKSLCFQAHPEFGPNECTEYFFNLIDEKLSHGNHSKAA